LRRAGVSAAMRAAMSSAPPPNPALAELADLLGEDNVRTLVKTFLRDFPVSIKELSGGDRKNRHRIAHSMKSNSRLVGANDLSARMAALEARLEQPEGPDITTQDIASIAKDFDKIVGPLRKFAGQ
jgi:HPt (histidine-containing phosphotransfer) domain-containing protein